jgi:hypothetical protein
MKNMVHTFTILMSVFLIALPCLSADTNTNAVETVLFRVIYDTARVPGTIMPVREFLGEFGPDFSREGFSVEVERETFARQLETLRKSENYAYSSPYEGFKNRAEEMAYCQACFDQKTFRPTGVKQPGKELNWQWWNLAAQDVRISSGTVCTNCIVIEFRLSGWDSATYVNTMGASQRVYAASSVKVKCERGANVLWAQTFNTKLPERTFGAFQPDVVVPSELREWLKEKIHSGADLPRPTMASSTSDIAKAIIGKWSMIELSVGSPSQWGKKQMDFRPDGSGSEWNYDRLSYNYAYSISGSLLTLTKETVQTNAATGGNSVNKLTVSLKDDQLIMIHLKSGWQSTWKRLR